VRSAPITPLELPRGVKHLLVYGGSFDPPHFYHTVAPLSVVGRVYSRDAWILYVPAARSPHKRRGPFASDEHRLAMLALALDVPGPRSVWTDEIDRARWQRERGQGKAPSYMVDTLRRLKRVLPREGITLRLLIGSDQVAGFHTWKDARKVIELAEPLVLVREPVVTAGAVVSALDAEFWTNEERRAWCTRLAPNFPMDPSSTGAREAIPGAPLDPEKWGQRAGLNSIITPVARYIIEHNLYGFRKGPAVAPKSGGRMPKGALTPTRAQADELAGRFASGLARAVDEGYKLPKLPRRR
jgi:nicotinate (nicotinamide) nucleotide adenylyltransferase